MPAFSARSKTHLMTCHPALQELFNEIVKTFDCTVICGHRMEEEQTAAYNANPKRSKVEWPNSWHNQNPSLAVDVAPYDVINKGIDWDSKEGIRQFYHFGGYVRAKAEEMGISIKWGGDWDGDYQIKDNNFNDLPHFELTI